MSKRNYKQNLAKKPEDVRRPGAAKKPLTNKTRAASGKAVKGGARAFEKPAPKATPQNVLTVRIVGAVVAVLALAGGIAWAVTAQNAVSPWVILGLVALGLVAGLAIFAAVRPGLVASRWASFSKR